MTKIKGGGQVTSPPSAAEQLLRRAEVGLRWQQVLLDKAAEELLQQHPMSFPGDDSRLTTQPDLVKVHFAQRKLVRMGNPGLYLTGDLMAIFLLDARPKNEDKWPEPFKRRKPNKAQVRALLFEKGIVMPSGNQRLLMVSSMRRFVYDPEKKSWGLRALGHYMYPFSWDVQYVLEAEEGSDDKEPSSRKKLRVLKALGALYVDPSDLWISFYWGPLPDAATPRLRVIHGTSETITTVEERLHVPKVQVDSWGNQLDKPMDAVLRPAYVLRSPLREAERELGKRITF